MKKLLAALLLVIAFNLQAQNLIHFGTDSVSVNNFLKAYKKNHTGPRNEASFREYLNLYIASRLKIAEARSMGLDTLPQMVGDMQSLRQQLLPGYLMDKEALNGLANEAFLRAQKEIRVAHIYISAEQPVTSEKAAKKADSVIRELNQKGALAFADIAKKYSDDPSAKINGGEIGWITVFSLPYEIENLVYKTSPGKYSELVQSKAGFHILKNLGERKPSGRMKASQILLAFPPDASELMKLALKKKADSIYARILKGDDFARLAREFSNDVISSASNGQIPEFGIGEYDPAFEQAAFALATNGAVSKPVLTPHGYHIIKRTQKIPVATINNAEVMDHFLQQVELSDRMMVMKNEQYQKLLTKIKLTEPAFSFQEVITYTDSILNFVSPKTPMKVNGMSVLFQLSDHNNALNKSITAADWIGYAQVYRFKADGSGFKNYPELWKEFMEYTVSHYYEDHLEHFNEDFRFQLNEFRDGNLFFEVMQQKIWGPAQTDTAALLAYYVKHKNKYQWKPSADAIIFFSTDAAAAKEFISDLKKNPMAWSELVTDQSEKIAGDSSRFELDQIPGAQRAALKKGMVTEPVLNKKDNTVSFAYIMKLYMQPSQKSFTEAKGQVISDYQEEAEKAWLQQLKSKYPLIINQQQLEQLVKNKSWN